MWGHFHIHRTTTLATSGTFAPPFYDLSITFYTFSPEDLTQTFSQAHDTSLLHILAAMQNDVSS